MTSNQRTQPRRPSLSMAKPMSWLSGNSNKSVASPITISEPKLLHDVYIAGTVSEASSRQGTLGAGATVVRTPREALTTSMRTQPPVVQYQQRQRSQQSQRHEATSPRNSGTSSSNDEIEPPSPGSPPPRVLPFPSKSTPELMDFLNSTQTAANTDSMVQKFRTHSISPRTRSFVPPAAIPECPPQPACVPILLSSPPDVSINPSALMITLDTSTSSLRTTYSTLTSRPSHLADYLSSLTRTGGEPEKRNFHEALMEADEEAEQEEDGVSILPPPDTPFASLFTAHLNSVGLVPRSAGSIHLFLDRPSAPYTHILSYLRSPATSGFLPRSASLGHSFSQERFDALLELRDEAKYLGLEELYQLCSDELRQARTHARKSSSSGSISSNHSHHNSTSSGSHNVFIPGSSDRGRAPVMMHMLREHHVNNSKFPKMVNRERPSSGNSGAIPQTAEVFTMSPISSPARSRSRDQPSSSDGWI